MSLSSKLYRCVPLEFVVNFLCPHIRPHEGVGCGGSARGWREFMISRVAGFTSLPSDGGVEQWCRQHGNSRILGDQGGITSRGYHGGITGVSWGYHRFEHTPAGGYARLYATDTPMLEHPYAHPALHGGGKTRSFIKRFPSADTVVE